MDYKTESRRKDWNEFVASLLSMLCVVIGAVLYIVYAQRDANYAEIVKQKSALVALQSKEQTLDLALEFGFDPMIVQTVQHLAEKEFKAKHAPITWRFVKTDKELCYLVLSIIQRESSGDATARNKTSSAAGLTQLLYSTARQYDKNVTQEDLLTIPKNLEISMTHFVELLEKFKGNPYLAMLAWNRGITGADRILTAGIGSDAYVTSVFEQAAMRNAR